MPEPAPPEPPARSRRATQLALALALAFAGLQLGERYIARLPDHRGHYLVAVDDVVAHPPPRPRHTIVIVVDGLGQSFARPLRSVARLAARGHCRITDVGPISVSRPVYAVLSTGLEQDRTGARNNDEQSPLAAESLWDVARAAGLTVTAVSDLEWWRQLFPTGFSEYTLVPESADSFAQATLADLTLIHPVYIDHAGHSFGAASPEYAAAVTRVDREIEGLLDRIDLGRDLVLLTADHGHADTGGHGGVDPQITEVLTCLAGPGVVARAEATPIHTHALAGTLALLLGLRFPRHMRAGEDDLDLALTTLDPTAFSPAYLADRRAAIDHHRAVNHASLAVWLGHPGEWSDLYAAQRRTQWLRALAAALVVAIGFTLVARRRRLGTRGALALAIRFVLVLAATLLLHFLLLGSLDWTAINTRERYLLRAPLICVIPAVLAIAWVAWSSRDTTRLLGDQMTFAALALALSLVHIVTFGWPLGFPLPGPLLLLFPFLGAFLIVIHALLAACLACLPHRPS